MKVEALIARAKQAVAKKEFDYPKVAERCEDLIRNLECAPLSSDAKFDLENFLALNCII